MNILNSRTDKIGFSTLEICRALHIPRERLREWIIRGYIKPSIKEASGSGTKSIFSRWDVYSIALFMELIESGYSREVASKHIKTFQDERKKDVLYIEFRRFSENQSIVDWKKGKKHSAVFIFSENNPEALDLSIGAPAGWRDSLMSSGYSEWDQVLLVNYKKIREYVDKALE
jgi:hypothetical protein